LQCHPRSSRLTGKITRPAPSGEPHAAPQPSAPHAPHTRPDATGGCAPPRTGSNTQRASAPEAARRTPRSRPAQPAGHASQPPSQAPARDAPRSSGGSAPAPAPFSTYLRRSRNAYRCFAEQNAERGTLLWSRTAPHSAQRRVRLASARSASKSTVTSLLTTFSPAGRDGMTSGVSAGLSTV